MRKLLNWNWLHLLYLVFICFLLVWCWNNESGRNQLIIDESGYIVNYAWSVKLLKVPLKTDDLDEIIDLYQESWEDIWYRDSLLIAQKYSQWLWVNAFAQDNLDVLEDQWLVLSDIDKKQIIIKKDWNKINAVIVNYKISEWFIEEIPTLYVSQLFIPNWSNIVLMSYITESLSVRNNMSKCFTQVQ